MRVQQVFVQVHWQCSPDEMRQEFAYFTDEVSRLMEQHGEIRFVCGFDS